MTSLLKVLQSLDAGGSEDRSTTQRNQQSSTSLELDLRFKMSKQSNARPLTPTSTSSTDDDESSSASQNDPQDDMIRRKLSMRAYHLPGNSWRQDLGMYMTNNHLVFGMCCHHRLHPVKAKQRLVILLGSLAFGLSATNCVYLYYLWGRGETSYDDTALSLSFGGDVVENMNAKTLTIDISHGMALLWTVGAAAHSFFDLALWHMIACGCMKQKCCKIAGWNLAVALVMVLVALTSFVVVVRAYEGSGDSDAQYDGSANAGASFRLGNGKADFQYLYGYLVELVLSLFVYSPVIMLTMFTGIMGCGAVPFLGGRPYEVRKHKRKVRQSSRDVDDEMQKV